MLNNRDTSSKFQGDSRKVKVIAIVLSEVGISIVESMACSHWKIFQAMEQKWSNHLYIVKSTANSMIFR